MVRISLHGRARVNVRQFCCRLLSGEHSQTTYSKTIKFLMKFLSSMCTENVRKLLYLVSSLIRPALYCYHGKSIVVGHIKTNQRLGRFDDMLILAAVHSGQNVSAVFWPR